MPIEKFSTIPISGSYPETSFGMGDPRTWLKITDTDHEEWCGVFSGGMTTSVNHSEQEGSPLMFVNACGQGYLINIDTRDLIYESSNDSLIWAHFIPGSTRIIAADWTNLELYDLTGRIWRSKRISLDGIDFEEINEDYLKVKINYYNESWPVFTLDLNSFKSSCEKELDFDRI